MLKVESWPIERIKPYDRNPRRIPETAVEHVANSIKEFGFNQPIVVDKHCVIVCGHTRRQAAIKLGLTEVPVYWAKHLTEAQAMAYRLADNRTGEGTAWDDHLLGEELKAIEADFDLIGLGFNLYELSDLDVNVAEQAPAETFDDAPDSLPGLKQLRDDVRFGSNLPWNMPELRSDMCMDLPEPIRVWAGKYLDEVPDDEWRLWLWGSDSIGTCPRDRTIVSFYTDDRRFTCFFEQPHIYTAKLLNLGIRCANTPNYSLYTGDTGAERLWATYRARFVGRYFQEAGIRVIPDVAFAGPDSYEYCFLGLPRDAPCLSVQFQNASDNHELEIVRSGLKRTLDLLTPKRLMVYGGEVGKRVMDEFDMQGVPMSWIDNRSTVRFEKMQKKPVGLPSKKAQKAKAGAEAKQRKGLAA